MTRAQYQGGILKKPPQLFSHADQVTQWQTSIPDQAPLTGWGGRCADLLNSVNANAPISLSVSLQVANTFEVGQYRLAILRFHEWRDFAIRRHRRKAGRVDQHPWSAISEHAGQRRMPIRHAQHQYRRAAEQCHHQLGAREFLDEWFFTDHRHAPTAVAHSLPV